MDRGQGGGAGAAVIARDEDHLGARLGHAAGDGADPGLRDQLDADAGMAVGVFQVEDELGQVLDGIDIVVRRRADQRDPRRRAARAGDPGVDLAAGQVAAFAGLGALGHFDLQLLRAVEVGAGHAEAAGGDLLDGRAAQGVVQAVRGLAALARVGLAAQGVHGDGEALVRLLRDRAVAHRAGFEAFDDALDRLDLVQGHAAVGVGLQVQQAPQGMGDLEVVHHRGVLLEGRVVALAGGLLEQLDGEGVVHMVLRRGAGAQLVRAHGVEGGVDAEAEGLEGLVVLPLDALVDLLHADALDTADGVGEVAVDDPAADADALKDLGRLVGLDRRDAHFGGDLHDAAEDGAVIVVDGGARVLVQHVQADQLLDALLGKVGVDGLGAVAEKRRKVVHGAGFGAFEDQGEGRALFGADKILLDGRDRQQRGDGDVVFVHAAVREDQDVRPLLVGPVAGDKEALDRAFQRRALVIQQRDRSHLQPGAVHMADLHQVDAGEDGVLDLQDRAVFGPLLQQVPGGAEVHRRVGHDLLADGVDGRVRHLGEKLLEVAEERLAGLREHGERDVGAHGGDGLGAGFRHGQDGVLDILISVAEGLVELVPQDLAVLFDLEVGDGQVLEMHQVGVQPLAVGALLGIAALDLLVLDHALLHGVDQQHAPGLETGFFHDIGGRDIQDADLGGEDQVIIPRAVPAAGAQAVAVQHRAHAVAVGEDDGGRAVPGLEHGGVILIEILFRLRHFAVVGPGLGDRHHHGLGELDAVHHEKLEGVVQHGRVRTALVHHREDAVHILVADDRRVHGLLPGEHAVHVAADGVDLAVVHDVAVGVGPLPAGVGVGGKARVDHGHGAFAVRVLQVAVKAAELVHQEHALVDDRAAGEGGDIGADVALLELAADDVEQAVKVQPLADMLGAADKALLDAGHGVPRRPAQDLGADGDLAPAEELDPVPGHDDLEHFARLEAPEGVLREKEHADAVAAGGAQVVQAELGSGFDHQLVGDLHHQADAVAGLAAGVLAGAVLQLFDDLECVVHRAAALLAADADDGADAAGVVLKRLPVQREIRMFSLHVCLPDLLSPGYAKDPPAGRRRSFAYRLEKNFSDYTTAGGRSARAHRRSLRLTIRFSFPPPYSGRMMGPYSRPR